jgi:hypothetical protein
MPRNPALTVINARPSPAVPPATLAEPGRGLWTRLMGAYDIADPGGLAMLEQACTALDRAETLRHAIEQDGAVIRKRGAVRDHPALKHELAARAFVVRTLARLGLDVEPMRPTVGRPPRGGIGWQP